jgi:hypothetical protein
MIPPDVKTALGPYLRLAFDSWRAASTEDHVVMVLQGSDGVSIYCLSVMDAQCALAEADTSKDMVAKMALRLASSPGDGRFWLLYMMSSCLGLISFRWRDYVSRSFN